ncbi:MULTISPECIES: RagB/SusD family nutrient uptake outer membrane protein [unclassified Sphingobacterium]|uniref:RagB/SusD family nutrient uptake outer membrane protein n=1 Tax=unclassified Sphingobacterium TaxID=2609468 RepID=UPI0025CD292F|nr:MULTISPECIES: RagB/SusD family nutrient uptake outer membrane protein [unclassified Sphingobacterium]
MARLTMLITVFSACSKDFLEVEPKGAVIASKTSDYELLLNDQVLGVIARASHIVMSDELAGYQPLYNPEGGIGSVNDRKAFEYQDDIYLPDENFSELSQLQRQLYSYNKIINEVMDSKEGSDTQKKTIHAEALACRAWVYFMLVNYYGKPYTAATAASDPGIFLIKTADVTQTVFKRSTVKEAYDQIIADLTEAIPLLSPRIVSRYRMSQSAAESILGKVYMNMQQFDKALPLFSSAIAKFSNAIIPVRLYDFNTVFIPGGAFFPVNPITGPNRLNQNVDEEVVYLKKFLNFYSYFYSGIPVSPRTAGLFDQGDLRLNFFTRLPFRSTGVVYPLNMMRAYGRYNNMGINVPDIILLKAECESRTGDLLNAVKDLEAFRKKRMKITVADAEKIPADIASDKVSLTKYILDERIREYAVTGERWWDMRRLSVDETYKSTVGMMHYVYDANGKIVESMAFPLKPERLTFRLPLYTINTNPGTEQNP